MGVGVKIMKFISYLFILVTLSGCGLFDGGSKHLTSEYDIGWIDTGCTMTIYRGPIGLMEGKIHHVGWNEDFIIAKQHPECDESRTSYFIINIRENQSVASSQTVGVYGPLTAEDFHSQFDRMGIPKELVFSYEP